MVLRSFITQPNMYARGILFGKMRYELGDHASIKCPESGLEADIEFKVKGWMGGTYNAIGGTIKDRSGKALYELSGLWTEAMYIKNLAVSYFCMQGVRSRIKVQLLTCFADWQERNAIRRHTRQGDTTKGSTNLRTERARVTEAVGEGHQGD